MILSSLCSMSAFLAVHTWLGCESRPADTCMDGSVQEWKSTHMFLQYHYQTLFGPSWGALEHELAHTLHVTLQGYWARWKATHQAGFTLPSPQVTSFFPPSSDYTSSFFIYIECLTAQSLLFFLFSPSSDEASPLLCQLLS